MLSIKQTALTQTLLKPLVTFFRIRNVAGFLINREVFLAQLGDNHVHDFIKLRPILCRTRDNQRRARLINQDRVDLIDDRKVMASLSHLVQLRTHVVTKVIEPKLIVGRVCDISGIGLLFLGLWLLWVDNTCAQTQRAINLRHPFRITFGQIIVNRHDVHTLTAEPVQIGRERCNEGFTLTCFHFSDVSLMQENTAHQLRIKRPQSKSTARPFTTVSKGFGQKAFEAFTTSNTLAKLSCLFN